MCVAHQELSTSTTVRSYVALTIRVPLLVFWTSEGHIDALNFCCCWLDSDMSLLWDFRFGRVKYSLRNVWTWTKNHQLDIIVPEQSVLSLCCLFSVICKHCTNGLEKIAKLSHQHKGCHWRQQPCGCVLRQDPLDHLHHQRQLVFGENACTQSGFQCARSTAFSVCTYCSWMGWNDKVGGFSALSDLSSFCRFHRDILNHHHCTLCGLYCVD